MLHRLAACAVCLLMVVPRLAPALELGPIETRSALYEPLDARIPMRDVQGGDIEGLSVTLGSPAQFELAGVARLPHLDLLQFTVVSQSDGGGHIHVSTDEPIIEPSLTFLIDVDWPRGRAVRGYRLHLSPAAPLPAAATPSVRPTPEVQREPDASPSAAAPASPSAGAATYGPVRSSETLWSIASRLRPDRSVSVQRMMLAILETNPEAFAIPNVNALNRGAVLRVPSREEIGSDDMTAAIAEVERQHEAWKAYRESGRLPTPPPTAVAPREPTPEPSGRVEVVSPETPSVVAGRAEDANTEALRNQLALAVEEADARRRQNDELTLRLSEAEDHIRELSRLVDLKNEEIAGLQAELRAIAETAPTPSETEPMPAPAPSETEPMPAPMPSGTEPVPAPAPSEAEPMPTPAPSEEEVVPAPAVAVPDEARPGTMPFGLGALPINPVFLVGGAGLLLILLGVVALLRRRRASAGEDELSEHSAVTEAESPAVASGALAEGADASPGDDDNLLLELEAVAADLADETDDRRPGEARAAPGGDSSDDAELDARERDILRFDTDDLPDEQMAALWPDDSEAERALLDEIDADDADDITFDLDALAEDEPDSRTRRSDTSDDFDSSDDFDISDLTDLADLHAETDEDARRGLRDAADHADDGFELVFDDGDDGEVDLDAPHFAAADGGGDPAALDRLLEDRWDASGPDGDEPLPSGVGSTETREPGVDPASAPAVRTGGAGEPGREGTREPEGTSQVLFDEATDDGDSGTLSLDDLGEDEVQTKIDLAQVYMEMGDTDSARGFLEAVLAEGDADQREAAREMLSKLT